MGEKDSEWSRRDERPEYRRRKTLHESQFGFFSLEKVEEPGSGFRQHVVRSVSNGEPQEDEYKRLDIIAYRAHWRRVLEEASRHELTGPLEKLRKLAEGHAESSFETYDLFIGSGGRVFLVAGELPIDKETARDTIFLAND